jgi:hypothetical protein
MFSVAVFCVYEEQTGREFDTGLLLLVSMIKSSMTAPQISYENILIPVAWINN